MSPDYCINYYLNIIIKFDRWLIQQNLKLSFTHSLCYFAVDGGDSGLNKEDLEASVATLQIMAEHLNCDTILLREKEVEDGKMAEYLVREKVIEDDFTEVR